MRQTETDVFASLRGVPTGEPRRWPVDPILVATGCTANGLSRSVGVPRLRPMLTDHEADRVAVACGWHPSTIWPDWFSVDVAGAPDEMVAVYHHR